MRKWSSINYYNGGLILHWTLLSLFLTQFYGFLIRCSTFGSHLLISQDDSEFWCYSTSGALIWSRSASRFSLGDVWTRDFVSHVTEIYELYTFMLSNISMRRSRRFVRGLYILIVLFFWVESWKKMRYIFVFWCTFISKKGQKTLYKQQKKCMYRLWKWCRERSKQDCKADQKNNPGHKTWHIAEILLITHEYCKTFEKIG